MKKKVLLTGANGQLGTFLKVILADSYDLVCATRADIDLSKPESVGHAIELIQPDIVVNAAAYTAVDKAESDIDTATKINALSVAELAKAVEKCGGILVHVSTDYVFDGTSQRPYCEEDEVGPASVYGATKLQGEIAAVKYCKKSIVIRTSWVFSEVGQNFVKTIADLCSRLPKLQIVSDQTGGPTYAGHLAEFIAEVLTQVTATKFIDWGIYHFCGYPYVSWYDFALEICQKLHSDILVEPVSSSVFVRPAPRPSNSSLDCSKAIDIFGCTPSDWRSSLPVVLAKPCGKLNVD